LLYTYIHKNITHIEEVANEITGSRKSDIGNGLEPISRTISVLERSGNIEVFMYIYKCINTLIYMYVCIFIIYSTLILSSNDNN
jgi:hypothetical protein